MLIIRGEISFLDFILHLLLLKLVQRWKSRELDWSQVKLAG